MEDFIEVINKVIKNTRKEKDIKCSSFLLMHKKLTYNQTFKAYKNYTISIHLVRQEKYPIKILEQECTFNSAKEMQTAVYKRLTYDLLTQLVELITGEEWDNLLNGTYKNKVE